MCRLGVSASACMSCMWNSFVNCSICSHCYIFSACSLSWSFSSCESIIFLSLQIWIFGGSFCGNLHLTSNALITNVCGNHSMLMSLVSVVWMKIVVGRCCFPMFLANPRVLAERVLRDRGCVHIRCCYVLYSCIWLHSALVGQVDSITCQRSAGRTAAEWCGYTARWCGA